jgi:hypothetical protein
MINVRSTIPSQRSNSSEEEISALPIWTVTLGVFALLTFGLTAIPSIICGHLALSKTRASNGRSFEKSVTTIGLGIGYASVTVLAIWIAVLVVR